VTTVSEKVCRRVQLVIGQIGESRIPKLLLAVGEAMDRRNRCVHEPRNESDADCEPKRMRFLTEVLGFIFAASDLVEAEWNMEAWSFGGGYPDPL